MNNPQQQPPQQQQLPQQHPPPQQQPHFSPPSFSTESYDDNFEGDPTLGDLINAIQQMAQSNVISLMTGGLLIYDNTSNPPLAPLTLPVDQAVAFLEAAQVQRIQGINGGRVLRRGRYRRLRPKTATWDGPRIVFNAICADFATYHITWEP